MAVVMDFVKDTEEHLVLLFDVTFIVPFNKNNKYCNYFNEASCYFVVFLESMPVIKIHTVCKQPLQ